MKWKENMDTSLRELKPNRSVSLKKTIQEPCSECEGKGEYIIAKENFDGFGEIDIYADCMVCNGTGFLEKSILIKKRQNGTESRKDSGRIETESERMGLAS